MPNKAFLEIYPLYKKFTTTLKFDPSYEHTYIKWSGLPKPAIHMLCSSCSSDQTFNMHGNYWQNPINQNEIIHDEIKEIRYICSACKKGLRIFLVHFGSSKINKDDDCHVVLQKVGQFPAWNIEIDRELEKILGDRSEYLKKGLINESQSYGIGAYAYFRRVAEEIIDELLELIYGLIQPEEQESYKEALNQAKKTRVAQEKIDLVKDLLPSNLKPDDINPLGIIHSALSEGLHGLSDEECMKQAELIRNSLTFLINQVIKTKNESASFTKSMRKMLTKKSEKSKKK